MLETALEEEVSKVDASLYPPESPSPRARARPDERWTDLHTPPRSHRTPPIKDGGIDEMMDRDGVRPLEKRSLFRFLGIEGKLYKKLKDNIFTKSNKLMEKHINNSINNVNIDIVIVR